MPRRHPALDEGIREIAHLLASAWLRLHLPDPRQEESTPGGGAHGRGGLNYTAARSFSRAWCRSIFM
jgi:hypothetical protein